MAKKPATTRTAAKKKSAKPKGAVSRTRTRTRTSGVRNSPIPKKKVTPRPNASDPAEKREITHDMIARRAYEISQSGACGGELDNWLRAERELHG